MKKILVPCDFSAPAQEAFKFAVKIATRSNGQIHVLHVLDITFLRGNPTLSHSYAFNLNFLTDMEKDAEARFRTMWEKYCPLTLPATFEHTIGSLVPDILNHIQENAIDLVVMGTHGEGDGNWGSNADKVIRRSPVPVFAIRKDPGRDIKKIVVPVSPNQMDTRFSERLKKLQSFFGASLHFLWINTPRIFRNDSEALDELRSFTKSGNFENCEIEVRTDYNVEEGIYRFARDIDADMIAMGTHGWTGLTHFFTGSIAEDLVNHVNLPVWTTTLK